MADEYADAKPKAKKKRTKDDDAAICKQALERYARWVERERENTEAAYEDLKFRAGEQWPKEACDARKDRPMLTINRIPQFIRQVTGDMRQMRPSIKTVPVDSRGDKNTAQTIAGMIRYIENRSDAAGIYMTGAESQVGCGIGHWSVTKEYADGTTFNQELRIAGIDDQVAVACDPDAKMPMKEDAKWWIIPVDMSRESFKENYPDFSVEDFDDSSMASADGWFDQDFVRVAIYWVKKPAKRILALMPDGGTADLTDKDEAEREEIGQTAKRVEERESFKICRYLITAAHVLEEDDWPGMNIPIVPVIGEEVKIGKRTVRHGLTRFARDPQRMVNYYSSAEAEVVALQPKSPWIGTDKNFEKNQQMWATANTEAHNALIYTPDTRNGNVAPQRVQPQVSSQGISEGLDRAVNDMKGVIGIYDAGLGNKSNETSGKAILARQREGDVGTFVYIDNWSRSIRRTGAILIDLIPHVYDSERMIRIMGEDGKVDLKWINRPTGLRETDPATGQPTKEAKIENDVTVGAYDVVLETGPSFTTKREEAKDSMKEFLQSAPETAPIIMDLFAKAQDWPLADDIGERFEAMAPPPIQALLKKQKQEDGPKQPTPEEMAQAQAQAQQQQIQQAMVQLQLEEQKLKNDKIRAEIAKIGNEISQPQEIQTPQVNPAEQQAAELDVAKKQIDVQSAAHDLQHKQRMSEMEYHHSRADLAQKRTQASEEEVGEVVDQGVTPADKRNAELVQAMTVMAQAIQAGQEAVGQGLAALAQAIAAPKRVVRDQRNQVVGVEPATLN